MNEINLKRRIKFLFEKIFNSYSHLAMFIKEKEEKYLKKAVAEINKNEIKIERMENEVKLIESRKSLIFFAKLLNQIYLMTILLKRVLTLVKNYEIVEKNRIPLKNLTEEFLIAFEILINSIEENDGFILDKNYHKILVESAKAKDIFDLVEKTEFFIYYFSYLNANFEILKVLMNEILFFKLGIKYFDGEEE